MKHRIVVVPSGDRFLAHLAPEPSLSAYGSTVNSAAGNLLATHPEKFGVEILFASHEQAKIIDGNTPPLESPKPGHKWVKNLVGGKWLQIPENTPLCCDPSSETYHSM